MKRKSWLIFTVVSCLLAVEVYCQGNEIILTANDGTPGDDFGWAVSIDANYLLVGAAGKNAAYIFRKTATGWIQEDKLIPNSNSSWFAYSVSLDGEYAIIGARFGSNGLGSAHVFKRIADNWVEQIEFKSEDLTEDEGYGTSVAISGEYAMVGAPTDDEVGVDAGSVYVYRLDNGTWGFLGKLFATGAEENDQFGTTLDVDGGHSIIGAPMGGNVNGGAAYVFELDNNSWTEQVRLTASDEDAHEYFGASVSIQNDNCIVSNWQDFGSVPFSGAAYIFLRQGTNWYEEGKFVANNATGGEEFGWSAAIHNQVAIVGARGDGSLGANSGSAYLYRKDNSNWSFSDKITASNGMFGYEFGFSTDVNDDYIVIGTHGAEAVYLYDINPTTNISFPDNGINSFQLFQNYPNPFNSTTILSFFLPITTHVTLKVYDVTGKEIMALTKASRQAGMHRIEVDTEGFSSGIYFYQLKTDRFIDTKRMILLR